LGKEGDIEAEIKEIFNMGYSSAIDIHNIAYILKGKERDSYRQENSFSIKVVISGNFISPFSQIIDHFIIGVEKVVMKIGKEVGIFKIEKHQQVHSNPKDHVEFTFPLFFINVNSFPNIQAEESRKDKQEHKQSGGFIIEKDADQKEESVSEEYSVFYQSKPGKDNRKESPEIELSKK